jgi:hypothetical protein
MRRSKFYEGHSRLDIDQRIVWQNSQEQISKHPVSFTYTGIFRIDAEVKKYRKTNVTLLLPAVSICVNA